MGDPSSVTDLILLTPVATFLFVVLFRLPALALSEERKPHLKDLGVFAVEIFGIFSVLHFLVRPLAGHVLPILPPVWVSRVGEILLFLLIFFSVVRVWFDGLIISLTGRAGGKLNRLVKRLGRRIREKEHADAEIHRDNFEAFAISAELHTLDRIEAMEKEVKELKEGLGRVAEVVEDREEDEEGPPTKEVEEESKGKEEEIPEIPRRGGTAEVRVRGSGRGA